VDKTKSVVLIYQNKVFPSFFHATCAGHTEDASLLWDIDILPLKGVPCSFCRESPHFKWHSVLSLNKIEEKLAPLGYSECRNIKDIVVLERDNSGRIKNLSITTDKKDITLSAKDFRSALGPNIIRSTNFQVSITNHDAVFEGFGWGHGVGLCQWGAYFMARRKYKYEEILRYYYPGSEISIIDNR
jgi:stage II sporulation protein D